MAISLKDIFPWVSTDTDKTSYPSLRKGMKSSYVEVLQQQLSRNGFYSGRIDGDFGEQTYAAVVHFQQTHVGSNKQALDVDGVVGKQTWWALYNPSVATVSNKVSKSDDVIPANLSAKRLAVLKIATQELNKKVKEIPDGSNWGPDVRKYLEFCGIGPNPWCACFASWVVYNGLDNSLPWGSRIAHVATLYNKAKSLQMGHSVASGYKPRPGDLFVMVHSDGTGHIGVISRVSKDGKSLNVIEGNSGNKVALRTRVVGANDHVGYINYLKDEDTPYDFELGLIGNTDSSNILQTR